MNFAILIFPTYIYVLWLHGFYVIHDIVVVLKKLLKIQLC